MRRSFIKKFATSIKAIRGKSSNITYDTIKFAIARLIGRRSAADNKSLEDSYLQKDKARIILKVSNLTDILGLSDEWKFVIFSVALCN